MSGLNQQFAKLRMGLNLSTGSNPVPSTKLNKGSIIFKCIELFIIKKIMKEKIIELKNEGKSYRQIQKILNCSKGTISYHLGINQKEKTNNRTKKRRENKLIHKLDTFKYYKKLRVGSMAFQKKDNDIKNRYNKNFEKTFTWEDVIQKYGEDTICYLSGEKINLINDTHYNLDHIVPRSRDGNNELENLGILHETVNQMKGNLLNEELIDWCIKILNHNGYTITK